MTRIRMFAMMAVLSCVGSSLVGCSSVTLNDPLPMLTDPEQQTLLSGVWTAEGEILMVRFTSAGVGQVAGIEWKDETFHLERAEVTVSGGEALKVLSVRVQEDGEWADEYFFVSYDFAENGDLVVRMPDTDFFGEAVAAGRLQGEVDASDFGKDIRVTASPKAFLQFLLAQDPQVMFDGGEPMVLGRVELESR